MNPTLRRATPSDAPGLAILARWVWLDTYASEGLEPAYLDYLEDAFRPGALSGLLADPHHAFWVIESDRALQGFAQLNSRSSAPANAVQRPQVELQRLYVAPPCTGRGLGASLLAAARSTWPDDGLWLSVWAGNERAQRFYQRESGQVVGETDFILQGQAHRNLVFAWSPL